MLVLSLKPCLSAEAMWLFLSLLLCNALYNAVHGNHLDMRVDDLGLKYPDVTEYEFFFY